MFKEFISKHSVFNSNWAQNNVKESGLFLFLTLVNSNCAHSMPPSFPVMAQHWLLGQQVITNRTGMECFLFACNLDLFVMFEVPIHLMFVIHVKGTCRTCIVIEAQAWIKLSTMPVSKNTRYFSINIWLIFLRHFFWLYSNFLKKLTQLLFWLLHQFAWLQQTKTPWGWGNFPPKYTPLISCCSPAQEK